ncbi:NUDIX hydrolase [Kribbia dieselivorans]|uniref:NUDIX hydrolase n=1 Tax=Kribbia dieselivorans TaxID=331526 RepID=UPI001FDF7F69|nr:NUDIX hydrolase [Kribbia dieselivorans]
MSNVALAAGTLPWRRRRGLLEVALVHRPRYDDWAWAKGKLDRGEIFPVAAVRETLEETGLSVRLGRPLPTTTYTYTTPEGKAQLKEVRYWAAEVLAEAAPQDVDEVDEVVWLGIEAASQRLSYSHDRDQLAALARADQHAGLNTWSLGVLRHAKAQPRRSWQGDDRLRPLNEKGQHQAEDMVPLLSAYGLTRLISSPSVRAKDTLAPYAAASGEQLRLADGLSEEGFAAAPADAIADVERVLGRGIAAVLCSHGPVLSEMVAPLARIVDRREPEGQVAAAVIDGVMAEGLHKGEMLVTHLVGTGADARIVAAERHHPDDIA